MVYNVYIFISCDVFVAGIKAEEMVSAPYEEYEI